MQKKRLIQLIHIARNELGMDEDTYRQMLQGLTGKASTKGMDTTQLNCVLESMKKKGFRVKPARKASSGLPLDNHPQSRKIRALWLEMAAAGIVRTKDLKTWERLPNLVTKRSPQQRNVDLLPEFVNGKYAFYTRPMDDFIDTGSGGGVGFGLCEDITHAVIDEEIITSPRRYHTITEAKNGEGATPIKTEKGWLHIAHGVRNTAAGLRYVIYVFVTALDDPSKVIAEPSGFLIAPRDWERVGDVSNVVFTNGAIADDDGSVYIYYAASDTRLHVASTTIDKLLDFAFNTPADPLRSVDCVKQRCALIDKNLEYLKSIGE